MNRVKKNKDSRRRGEELLESLYDATLKLATTVKPSDLTFQQIADEANTSRTVLYRRWATPFDLLQAIYVHKTKKLFDKGLFNELKDNGTLRDDLLQLLTIYQKAYKEIGADIVNNYIYLRMQDKDDSKEPAVHKHTADGYLGAMKKILKGARARGEKIRDVSLITLMLPYDLVRTENLLRRGNISKKRLTMMVDEVLLPVFSKI